MREDQDRRISEIDGNDYGILPKETGSVTERKGIGLKINHFGTL